LFAGRIKPAHFRGTVDVFAQARPRLKACELCGNEKLICILPASAAVAASISLPGMAASKKVKPALLFSYPAGERP